MRALFPFGRVIGISIVILVLCLVLACATAGPPRESMPSPAKASIVAVPNVIDIAQLKKTTLEVHGSGFTPGSIVSIGIRGLGLFKDKRDPTRDLWFGAETVHEGGAFTATIQLSRALSGIVRVITKKELCNAWTLVVRNKEGDIATTPLIIKAEQKKKKTK